MKIKSPLVDSKFGTEFPSFMISTWFTKIVFFFSVNGKSIAAGAAAYIIFSKFTSRCERKVSHLKERKKGSYVRFVDALAELRAIKIACSFLQKIMSAQKLQSLFIALR